MIEKKVILTVFASCWKKLVFVLKNYIFARTAFQWKELFFFYPVAKTCQPCSELFLMCLYRVVPSTYACAVYFSQLHRRLRDRAAYEFRCRLLSSLQQCHWHYEWSQYVWYLLFT